MCLPGMLQAQTKATLVSKGPRFELKKVLMDEGTTIVLFIQDTSNIEQQFVASLEKDLPKSPKLGLDLVRLKDLSAPAAMQYNVTVTPTAIVYDRFGRELTRTAQPDEIVAAVRKGQLMGRIKWVDEDDPKAPEVYGYPAAQIKRGIPGIVKTMALRPDAYKMFNIMSAMHFSDGFLKRREHEMIAAYVSSLNRCKF
jgi:hypothetical protein